MTTYVTINGHTYSDGKNDGGSGIRFLANGGHRANFLLLLADIVAVAGGVGGTEVTDNKVTSISGASTDVQYPSAKLLYDQLQLKASLSAVIAQAITGFSAGAGTVAATDTVLQAFNKIVGNIDAINLFKTIAVSGQSDVVADTATDTLTLVAGTNVTITTDAATDSITINASSTAGSETVTSIGALINGATAKTTPVDADMLGLMDSAASNVLKKLSWLNVKATLKTYFDTLYAVLTVAQSWTKAQRITQVGLTSTAASIAIDLDLSNEFTHTLTENTTLANPTNIVAGQCGSIVFTQHASAAKTLAFGSYWKSNDGTAQALSTTVSAVNVLTYHVDTATQITFSLIKHGVA